MKHNPETTYVLASVCQQARTLFEFALKNEGVSALDAFVTFQITSATLARRICDLEQAGIPVERVRKKHPQTGRSYTRYVVKPLVDLNLREAITPQFHG